jgi:hypothetical protein
MFSQETNLNQQPWLHRERLFPATGSDAAASDHQTVD